MTPDYRRREDSEDAPHYKACPACPDGQVWNMDGPTGATCPVCKGYAAVKLNGQPLTKSEWEST